MQTNRFFLLAFLFAALLASCNEDESLSTDVAELNYLLDASEDQVVDALILSEPGEFTEVVQTFGADERTHAFSGDCFVLVYPVTVLFADGSSATVNDQAELRTAVQDYLAANPDQRGRANLPRLEYPVTIQLADGTLEQLDSRRELAAQLRECAPDVERCYTMIFPVEVNLGGTILSIASGQELRDSIRAYRAANPDGARTELVFPIDFESVDGDIVTVNSAVQIRRLRQACRRDRRRDCFSFVYPITLENANGDTRSADGPVELRRALSHANPRGRWSIVFPISVTVDGQTQTIDSAADLRGIRRGCN